jgi:hypothetical protein
MEGGSIEGRPGGNKPSVGVDGGGGIGSCLALASSIMVLTFDIVVLGVDVVVVVVAFCLAMVSRALAFISATKAFCFANCSDVTIWSAPALI